MFDHDDAGDVTLVAALSTPATWVGLAITITVALVAYHFAQANQRDCEVRTCPAGTEARLMDHACLCVSPAR